MPRSSLGSHYLTIEMCGSIKQSQGLTMAIGLLVPSNLQSPMSRQSLIIRMGILIRAVKMPANTIRQTTTVTRLLKCRLMLEHFNSHRFLMLQGNMDIQTGQAAP